MAKFVFEGEVASLTPRQQEFLSEVLEKRGYKDNKVNIQPVGIAGDNYVANVKRITVEQNDGDIFKMIAKVAPTNEMMRAMTGISALFANEITIYGEIFPKFADLQKTEGISAEEIFRFPECYGMLTEEPNELILLEDLRVLNFEMLDRFKPLSDECIKLVLKNLAIYHSLSMVLKTKNTELFEELSKKFTDALVNMMKMPMFAQYIHGIEASVLAMLEEDKYKNAVQNNFLQLPKFLEKVSKDQNTFKHSVILQGDVWTNNLLFKMQDNHPLECVMIDYQQSRLSNPVCDVLNLIFNCTDHETRVQHYSNWIDYYHSTLEKALFTFNIKINFIYPRDQLDADLQRYSKLVFATSILMSAMMTTKPEDAAKLKAMMENDQDGLKNIATVMDERSIESLVLMKKKIEELVDSCRKFGYID